MLTFIFGLVLAVVAILAALAAAGTKQINAKVELDDQEGSARESAADSSTTPESGKSGKPRPGSARGPAVTAVISGLISVTLLVASFVYTQDEGEAKVIRSIGGHVVGSDTDPGFGVKAPWDKAVTFDIRNNVASYVGDGGSDYAGGIPTGNQISFTDKDSAPGNMDVVVTYSIDPGKVEEIYAAYLSEANFRTRLIEQDIRSVARQVPGKYTTVEVLGNREKLGQDLQAALSERWKPWGVSSVHVALQEVRYPESITARFESLAAERTRAEEAKAATQTAEEKAKQKLVEAQAEADANRLLEKSLTPGVLEQRRIEMLKSVGENGNLIIVPEDGGQLINIDGGRVASEDPAE